MLKMLYWCTKTPGEGPQALQTKGRAAAHVSPGMLGLVQGTTAVSPAHKAFMSVALLHVMLLSLSARGSCLFDDDSFAIA